jgi:hypothetical protein
LTVVKDILTLQDNHDITYILSVKVRFISTHCKTA